MDLHRIARRVAKYDFRTKAKLNAFILNEVAKQVVGHEPNDDDYNKISEAMLESPLHQDINLMAEDIASEVDRISGLFSQ